MAPSIRHKVSYTRIAEYGHELVNIYYNRGLHVAGLGLLVEPKIHGVATNEGRRKT